MDATLRKAAILVDSLDSQSANALLERFSADESAKILEARVHLHEIPENERTRVIREFYAENAIKFPEPDKIQPESSVALQLMPSGSFDELECVSAGDSQPASKSLEFLADTDIRTLARHLADQPSRAIALVLCHLAPDRAAEILKQLPDAKQIDVVFRMSSIEDLSSATVRDVEQSLKEVLKKNDRGPGFDAVLSIMGAVDASSRLELIGQLHSQHHELASQLADSIDAQQAGAAAQGELGTVVEHGDTDEYEFEDLVQMERQSLATLIQEADPQEVLLALTGAPPWMVTRFLEQLPSREEKVLRQKMDKCGPLALRDVAVAQNKLVELAASLATEGRITPPPRRPFTSVV